MNRPWRCLEEMHTLSGVAAEWKRHTGSAFESFRVGFLQKAKRLASSFPCPHKAGCAHQVFQRGDGFIGVCKDDDGTGCDDIPLTAADVEVWELNFPRLGRAVAQALKCDLKDTALGLERTRQIASIGDGPLPILLTIQHDEDGFADTVARLVARFPKGFILLAPTSRFCNAAATELLGRVNAGFFTLEQHVNVMANGTLHAPKSGGELFVRYLPEKQNDLRKNEAIKIIAILSKLRSERARQKAPLFDVFKLLVMDGMTQKQAARECKCSPGLMSLRVKQLEKRFGMKVNTLRNYTSDIQESSVVKGDRFRKKKQGAQPDAYEPGEAHGSEDSPEEDSVDDYDQ
jgi:hypothetical protein